MSHPAAAPSHSPRRQSQHHAVPMPMPMPVRAGSNSDQMINNNNTNRAKQSLIQPGHHHQQQQSHHRSSMPPPSNTTRQSHDIEKQKYMARQQKSVSSRPTPSPSSSNVSSDKSLRETSRANIAPPHQHIHRGSMPSPRQPSSTLDWDSVSSPSPKEQWLETPKEQWSTHQQPQISMKDELELNFEHLLDSLQVPETVRQKFATVSSDVKSSILSSTLTSKPAILSSLGLPVPNQSHTNNTPKIKKRMSTPLLRKAKSSSSLGSPGRSPQVGKTYSVEGDSFIIVASPLSSPNPEAGGAGVVNSQRGQPMDVFRPATMRQSTGPASSSRPMSLGLFGPSSSNSSVTSLGKANGKGLGIAMGEQPEPFIHWLKTNKATNLKMEVARAKKLRMLLRHEATYWVASFLDQGGYKLILERLQDLLDVEWREEQHDDQMLYELLRCVKALSTSEIGKTALREAFPNPFNGLSTLLFSEKKPGDLPTRQIIVELWLFLYDLFPSMAAIPSRTPGVRPTSIRFDQKTMTPADMTAQLRAMLVPDLPDPTKDHHEFVTQAHRPRVFKAWVGELSDICRDYFWIMCHASNTLWTLNQVDERKVEKPTAPSGATGGVEFEAMNYVTTHFKLLNALCRRQAEEDDEKALQLHSDLMASGMDRILVTLRKASTTYYPTLHLELARYVSLLERASPNGKLPYLMSKMVGPPPEEMRRFDAMSGASEGWLPMPAHVGLGGARRNAYDGH